MTDPEAIDAIADQVRGVRRRRNALAIQAAAYRVLAATALAGAAVVLAAVRAGRLAFGIVLAAATTAAVAAAVAAVRSARRGWLRRAAAAGWTDRTARLQGRLPTLLALRRAPNGPFEHLLVAQASARLRSFRPERLVPRVVPWRPGAAAALAAVALVCAVVAAPRLRPDPPAVLVGDGRLDLAAGDATDGTPTQLLVAPGTVHPAATESDPGATDAAVDPTEALAALSGSLQDWVRDAVLGEEAWDAGPPSPLDGSGPAARRRDAPRAPHEAPDAPRTGTPAADGVPQPSGDPGARAQSGEGGSAEAGDGAAGTGAGTATDPELFGAEAAPDGDGGGRFELAIAARVRTRPGGAFDPAGVPADAEPDLRPALAGGARRPEHPAHRMAVPPAWERAVGRLFAHAPESPP